MGSLLQDASRGPIGSPAAYSSLSPRCGSPAMLECDHVLLHAQCALCYSVGRGRGSWFVTCLGFGWSSCAYLGMWWCFASHVMTSLDTRHRSHLPVPELACIFLSPATTAMLLLASGWYLFDHTADARSGCRDRIVNLVMP